MPWYIYALLTVFIGAFAAVSQKWALNFKINRTRFLVIVFNSLLILYFLYSFNDLKNILAGPNWQAFVLWGILIAVCSMLGNIFAVKAYQKSPNPGYVQAITSTNAILILISAALIFGSSLSWLKAGGVVIVLLGLWPLLQNGRSKKDGAWQIPALVATISYGGMVLVVKQMSNLGFSAQSTLTALFFFASIGFWLLFLVEHPERQKLPKLAIVPVVCYILLAFIANIVNFIAVALAPNAGYVASIGNSSVLVVLILSIIFFPKTEGGDFNLKKWAGALIVILGVVLTII